MARGQKFEPLMVFKWKKRKMYLHFVTDLTKYNKIQLKKKNSKQKKNILKMSFAMTLSVSRTIKKTVYGI